jgi:hypothetical protein
MNLTHLKGLTFVPRMILISQILKFKKKKKKTDHQIPLWSPERDRFLTYSQIWFLPRVDDRHFDKIEKKYTLRWRGGWVRGWTEREEWGGLVCRALGSLARL